MASSLFFNIFLGAMMPVIKSEYMLHRRRHNIFLSKTYYFAESENEI
jgi:hypothetical protein